MIGEGNENNTTFNLKGTFDTLAWEWGVIEGSGTGYYMEVFLPLNQASSSILHQCCQPVHEVQFSFGFEGKGRGEAFKKKFRCGTKIIEENLCHWGLGLIASFHPFSIQISYFLKKTVFRFESI